MPAPLSRVNVLFEAGRHQKQRSIRVIVISNTLGTHVPTCRKTAASPDPSLTLCQPKAAGSAAVGLCPMPRFVPDVSPVLSPRSCPSFLGVGPGERFPRFTECVNARKSQHLVPWFPIETRDGRSNMWIMGTNGKENRCLAPAFSSPLQRSKVTHEQCQILALTLGDSRLFRSPQHR